MIQIHTSRQFLARTGVPVSLLLVTLLCGCSFFDTKKDDYKRAGRLPPLEIPPTLSAPTADDRYTIPDPKDVAASATYSEYAKSRGLPTAGAGGGYVPGIGVDPKSAQAHIEVAGAERWLVVNGSPDQVWNTTRTFLTESGYEIGAENPAIGVLETEWISGKPRVEDDGILRNLVNKVFNNDNATGVRDRYRFRIDRGRKDGTCEIFVTQKGLEEVVFGTDRTVWQPRPSDPDKEAEMLKLLLLKFGVDIPDADKQLAAAQPAARVASANAADVAQAASAPAAAAGAGNLRIDTGSAGEPRLVTGDNFDRAWRRIGLAIDKSGLSPQDQNRDNGVYVVQYSADKVKDPSPSPGSVKGFLGTLSSVGKSIWSRITDTDTSSPDKPVVIKGDGFVAGGPDLSAVKIPDGTYRLALSHEGDAPTHITVLDKDGQAPDPGVARKLLNVIAAQLR